jgi:hypothetical protein
MTSQYGAYALHVGLARLHALTRMRMTTRPGTHTHVRTRTHEHTDQCVTRTAFPRQKWFHQCASVLHYAYIACLVCIKFCDI